MLRIYTDCQISRNKKAHVVIDEANVLMGAWNTLDEAIRTVVSVGHMEIWLIGADQAYQVKINTFGDAVSIDSQWHQDRLRS